jgi:integrase
MRKLSVAYLIRREKTSRRRGTTVYLYWHPPKRYLLETGMEPCQLACGPAGPGEAALVNQAVRRALDLNDELRRRRSAAKIADPADVVGTLPWLIREWQSSYDYQSKKETTKRNSYTYACRFLIAWSASKGHPQVSRLNRPAIWKFREELYRPDPRTGEVMLAKNRLVLAVLRILLELAYNKGLIPENYASKPKAHVPKARTQIWTDEQIDTFIATAIKLDRFSLALAARIAADVALRREDILRATWSRFDGTSFLVKQGKTGEWIHVPALDELINLIERLPRGPDNEPIVAMEGTKLRYSKDYFSHEVRRVMAAAGLPQDLEFRDLRRTSVVHMGRAGLSPALITSVSGHNVDECMRILEVYMPRDSEMARRAIERMRAYRAELRAGNEARNCEAAEGTCRQPLEGHRSAARAPTPWRSLPRASWQQFDERLTGTPRPEYPASAVPLLGREFDGPLHGSIMR